MIKRFVAIFFLFSFTAVANAQQITFSEPYRDDIQTMNFDILGKMNGNTVIFKNVRWKYALNFFNDSMRLVKQAELEYLPSKTVNVDCIAYSDHIWLIYQHQKKGILYCMAQKVDGQGEKLSEPVEIDTTSIGSVGDNKIYSAIYSDDKKSIVVFKMQRKDDRANFLVKHFDKDMQLRHQSRFSIPFEDRKNNFGDFFADNEGNFVFSDVERANYRDGGSRMSLFIKSPGDDTLKIRRVPFDSAFADDVMLKIDNLNKRYIISTLYYTERSGNIEGLYNYIYDALADSTYASVFTAFNDELRAVARATGRNKSAFDDFFLRNVVLKKDGSFIITAEDQTSQTSGVNGFNRFDYLYGSPFFSPYDYYMYTPSYFGMYRPFNSFANPNIRYYNDNILILSVSKTGIPEWTNIIHKQQVSDENDNYLSFNLFNTSGEIHFLYNDISKRDKLLSDNIVTPDGKVKRNPTLRTYERGFEFMPKFAKQVGARQLIVPCTYRGQICFAKVDF
jgi:hypothetical protein